MPTLNTSFALRVIGVVLASVVFWHYQGIPWSLVSTAAIALLVLA